MLGHILNLSHQLIIGANSYRRNKVSRHSSVCQAPEKEEAVLGFIDSIPSSDGAARVRTYPEPLSSADNRRLL